VPRREARQGLVRSLQISQNRAMWTSRRLAAAVLTLSLAVVRPVFAQSTAPVPSKEDHSVVYELGWAGAWSHDEGWQPKGATFAFEKTPIEGRLELECGVTAIRSHGVTETSVDLLFKKPWTLSQRVEFMAGVGPEIVHASDTGTFWGLSAVADFMFWPKKDVGWYLEPGYEADFRKDGTRHGLAVAAGLIIGR
jgi:hypothetical protein